MSYVIAGVLEISAWLHKDSRILFCVLFSFLLVMFGLNYANPDYMAYENIYKMSGGGYEPLFALACTFFSSLHLSFQGMLFCWSAIGLALIASTVLLYSPYPSFVFALYLIYPFCMDIVQIRSFMAGAIIIYSLRFIIRYHKDDRHEKKEILFFALAVLIATGIHYSAVLYGILLLLFCDIERSGIVMKIIIPLFCIIAIY